MNAAEVFLRALFGTAPSDYFILVWTLPDKRSRFFDGVTDELLEYIKSVKSRADVYIGVGLRKQQRGEFKRGTANDVEVLIGLWADLDYAGEGHRKPGLPNTLEEVRDFVLDLPLKPTTIVHTGGGIHCWWLFKEPWILDTPGERKSALDLVWRWQRTITARAKRRGEELTNSPWAVDSVHDLARVLRLPGTLNRKTDPAREVTFLQEPDESLRLDPTEFDPYLIDCEPPPPSADPTQHIDADLPTVDEARARMNWRKHHALSLAEAKFERTWKRKRRDLRDSSPSGYDFALTNYLVMNEWDDQEIIDALIVWRAEHDEPQKRLDYYAHTIMRVRDTLYEKTAVEELVEDHVAGNVGENPLGRLSEVLGFDVLKVRFFDGKDTTFVIEVELKEAGADGGPLKREIRDLTTKDLQVFATFQAKVAGAVRAVIPPGVKKEWGTLWGFLVKNATPDENFGESASPMQAAKDNIENYLADHGPTPDIKSAVEHHMPFIKEGTIWLYGGHFRGWLARKQEERPTRHEFGQMMTSYGAASKPQDIAIRGARTTRLYWCLPRNEFIDDLVRSTIENAEHEVGEPLGPGDPFADPIAARTNGVSHHGGEELP